MAVSLRLFTTTSLSSTLALGIETDRCAQGVGEGPCSRPGAWDRDRCGRRCSSPRRLLPMSACQPPERHRRPPCSDRFARFASLRAPRELTDFRCRAAPAAATPPPLLVQAHWPSTDFCRHRTGHRLRTCRSAHRCACRRRPASPGRIGRQVRVPRSSSAIDAGQPVPEMEVGDRQVQKIDLSGRQRARLSCSCLAPRSCGYARLRADRRRGFRSAAAVRTGGERPAKAQIVGRHPAPSGRDRQGVRPSGPSERSRGPNLQAAVGRCHRSDTRGDSARCWQGLQRTRLRRDGDDADSDLCE